MLECRSHKLGARCMSGNQSFEKSRLSPAGCESLHVLVEASVLACICLCIYADAILTIAEVGWGGAAMARVFVLKLGVLPDRVLVPLLNDRMVAKVLPHLRRMHFHQHVSFHVNHVSVRGMCGGMVAAVAVANGTHGVHEVKHQIYFFSRSRLRC